MGWWQRTNEHFSNERDNWLTDWSLRYSTVLHRVGMSDCRLSQCLSNIHLSGVLSAVISCDTAGAMWNCFHLSDHSVYDNITGNVYSAFRNSVCYSNYTYICRKHTKHCSREKYNDITEINTRSIIPDCLSFTHTCTHTKIKNRQGLIWLLPESNPFPCYFYGLQLSAVWNKKLTHLAKSKLMQAFGLRKMSSCLNHKRLRAVSLTK